MGLVRLPAHAQAQGPEDSGACGRGQHAWPGATAEEVEQLVSRPVEQTIAQNPFIKAPLPSDFGIRSISFPGLSLVYVQLDDSVTDTKKQFADINLKLNALNDKLPQGAGPIQFNSDFGDTAALMLTVASPPASQVDIALRARSIERCNSKDTGAGIKALPGPAHQRRVCLSHFRFRRSGARLTGGCYHIRQRTVAQSTIRISSKAADSLASISASKLSDEQLSTLGDEWVEENLHRSEIHPDAWKAVFIRDPGNTESRLAAVAGDKYSYRELDDYTDLIARTLQGAPEVAKVDRKGVLRSRST